MTVNIISSFIAVNFIVSCRYLSAIYLSTVFPAVVVILALIVVPSPSLAGWLDNLSSEIAAGFEEIAELSPDAGQTSSANSTTEESAEEILVKWQYVLNPDSGAGFAEISDFINNHPTWPDQQKIRFRAERAMRNSEISDQQIISWFKQHPPVSGLGKLSYAEVLSRQNPDYIHKSSTDVNRENNNINNNINDDINNDINNDINIAQLAREGWRDADLTADEENIFLSNFSGILNIRDHFLRVDRLLWEEKITPALRIINSLPVAEQVLFQTRIAYMRDEKNAEYLSKQIISSLRNDPGLLYEKLRQRFRRNDKNAVRDLLLHAPNNLPYPEKWWKIREGEIRRAISEDNYKMALRLLANHSQAGGSALAEALWLEGWLSLRFAKNPSRAYKAFYHMHDSVSTPVSKARAAYWAGRSAREMLDENTAKGWFETASKHMTTFYGQLAAVELADKNNKTTISLPDEPELSFFDSDPILSDHIKEAIRISIKNGDHKIAARIIQHVIEEAKSEHSILAAAALGHELNVAHISVQAAKKAQAQGVVLKNVGYPRPTTEAELPIERALILAIIRQESAFDRTAESPSGARGMMQLLPSTAQETAKKIGADFNRDMLDEPQHNIRLGSNYLARLIEAYDGSYILSIAAYNAGPGNVRKWLKTYGNPGSDPQEAIDWIERIPFQETRNYVQRVLENLQVYRALEGNSELNINADITK